MVKKIIGYVLALIGLAGFALTIPQVTETVKISLPDPLTGTTLTFVSLALLLIGVFIVVTSGRGGKQTLSEVPIFRGKQIIGYRQV
ncbi:hypothetical protein AUJ84_04665 [Candidatus Pacearchaeota archaeon CG1_02_32_132]|nr:MAG: hypothetical protein AUJ84_04665 [Candidatus Pacearchaeota archaeon CG1_02_32_132]